VTTYIRFLTALAGLAFMIGGIPACGQQGGPDGGGQPANKPPAGNSNVDESDCEPVTRGSPYIPVDSWVYPAVLRLYALGYVDKIYLNMRPWTRASLSRMLDEAEERLQDVDGGGATGEAEGLYEALKHELRDDTWDSCAPPKGAVRAESVYSVERAMSGTPLRDSYHLGSTVVNDYGRPYANGCNDYSGASGYAFFDRFLLYVRGEFQGAPSSDGYSSALVGELAALDGTAYVFNPNCFGSSSPSTTPACVPMPNQDQTTMPVGPVAAATRGRVMEAYVSAQYLNHVISFGKQDEWQSPAEGGSMSYSNNAENIYSFRINRIEPLDIPLLSRLTGPFRYEFLVGPLKGHTYPIDPWVHVEKVSFRPTKNLEFGFERSVIWGGKDHEPITIKSFLRSFFSLTATNGTVKNSPQDPGARFGAFDFSYRLPFVRNWLTLYSDSEVHDDISPIDAPRRASWRPGLYLSHVPGIPKLDVRVEAATTAPPVLPNPYPNTSPQNGHFMYYEAIQRQGYTNNGQLFGDWIGREDKGGQGWITYHLSGNEWIQVSGRYQKATTDFIPGGTTLNDINFQAAKRIGKDLEIKGNFAFEHWQAPIYLPGQQTVTTTTIQLTWFPGRKINF
jgi:Capsule assembly protein Wzi